MKAHIEKKSVLALASALSLALLAGCASDKSCCGSSGSCCAPQSVRKAEFGSVNGQAVDLYTLQNEKGAMARISTFGGTLTSLQVPDRNGKLVDVVLGNEDAATLAANNFYLNCIIGRYGNRIGKGKFTLDGKEYTLATNNGENHLHGGPTGFFKRIWSAKSVASEEGAAVEMTYRSADGEESYPGNLDVTALFTLTDDNELKVEFTAKTDKPTVCNLTYHPYFNLSGGGSILDHVVQINADKMTPTDAGSIPTGETRDVTGTPFDFRKPTAVGARIEANDEQLKFGAGYDHNWVVNQKKPGAMTKVARVTSAATGITMEISSTEPCVQFYSGNFLDGTFPARGGGTYAHRTGLALEPEHAPDSPNKPAWPSVVLRPGQTYRNTIIYKFTAK